MSSISSRRLGDVMFEITIRSARRLSRVSVALFVLATLAGCSANTQPESGQLEVVFGAGSGGPSGSLIAIDGAAGSKQAGVPLDKVEKIEVTVTSIQVHRVGSDDDDEAEGEGDEGDGPWIEVDLAEGGTTVDLVGMSPQTIASGDVPAGTYNQLRLFMNFSTIVFSEPVTVGGTTYDAGTVYDLVIPSSDNTGIKVKTGFFDVAGGDSETVGLVVDLAESVKNVTANQNRVKMTPVINGVVGPEAGP
jgi:hypothetical protein